MLSVVLGKGNVSKLPSFDFAFFFSNSVKMGFISRALGRRGGLVFFKCVAGEHRASEV